MFLQACSEGERVCVCVHQGKSTSRCVEDNVSCRSYKPEINKSVNILLSMIITKMMMMMMVVIMIIIITIIIIIMIIIIII